MNSCGSLLYISFFLPVSLSSPTGLFEIGSIPAATVSEVADQAIFERLAIETNSDRPSLGGIIA